MIDSYEASTKHLIESGWKKENSGSFKKLNYELVFDTSQFVELYNELEERIAETSIKSLNDMIVFLNDNNI